MGLLTLRPSSSPPPSLRSCFPSLLPPAPPVTAHAPTGQYSPCLLTGSILALAVTPTEAWWAYTVVLATPVIDALASVPTGRLRGTDVLICRGDREVSGRVPHTWCPHLPGPRPQLCSQSHPELVRCSGGNQQHRIGVRRLQALALSFCLKVIGQLVAHLWVSVSSSVKGVCFWQLPCPPHRIILKTNLGNRDKV